jgi:hypothetical protein
VGAGGGEGVAVGRSPFFAVLLAALCYPGWNALIKIEPLSWMTLISLASVVRPALIRLE